MDRQLAPPLRLEPVSAPTNLNAKDTHGALSHYLASLPPSSTSRSQLERLVDSLGVDLGLIKPDESERREEERRAARAERRLERRKERERVELEGIEKEVEALGGGAKEAEAAEDDSKEEGEGMEEGAAEFEGEQDMGDRGDVEYGDEDLEEDEDEPDRHDEGQEKMDVDM